MLDPPLQAMDLLLFLGVLTLLDRHRLGKFALVLFLEPHPLELDAAQTLLARALAAAPLAPARGLAPTLSPGLPRSPATALLAARFVLAARRSLLGAA
jgi:hypothetical protein